MEVNITVGKGEIGIGNMAVLPCCKDIDDQVFMAAGSNRVVWCPCSKVWVIDGKEPKLVYTFR